MSRIFQETISELYIMPIKNFKFGIKINNYMLYSKYYLYKLVLSIAFLLKTTSNNRHSVPDTESHKSHGDCESQSLRA